jgi:hypothetical protein
MVPGYCRRRSTCEKPVYQQWWRSSLLSIPAATAISASSVVSAVIGSSIWADEQPSQSTQHDDEFNKRPKGNTSAILCHAYHSSNLLRSRETYDLERDIQLDKFSLSVLQVGWDWLEGDTHPLTP